MIKNAVYFTKKGDQNTPATGPWICYTSWHTAHHNNFQIEGLPPAIINSELFMSKISEKGLRQLRKEYTSVKHCSVRFLYAGSGKNFRSVSSWWGTWSKLQFMKSSKTSTL